MPTEKPLSNELDQELFAAASQDPPKEEPPKEEPPKEEPPKETPTQEEPPKEQQAQQPPKDETIPSWRLREEADNRRLAEDRARQLEDRLRQVTEHLRQAAGEEEKPPNFFEDPDGAMQANVNRALEPIVGEFRRQLAAIARSQATRDHGAEVVKEAEQAFVSAFESKTLDRADYEKVVTSPNQWDALAEWHKRSKLLSTVGPDPDAWFEKRLESMMSDEKFQAKVLEKLQSKASQSRSPTEVRLPPSLSDTPAARRERAGNSGMPSDEELFGFATQR